MAKRKKAVIEFIMFIYHRIKASYFTLILSVFFNYCVGQTTVSIPVKITNVHQDSISRKAETLPEIKGDFHDTEYPVNPISGVVRTVLQDKKGNIWFGTQNGLCRYAKNGLVYYVLRDWNGQTVTVHVIIEDKAGNIWIGYGGGIAKYDGNYFTVYHEKDILTVGGLWSMAMDKKGILWIGTTQGGYTFDGKALSPVKISDVKTDSIKGVSTTRMINSIIADIDGNIWFVSNGEIYSYDGNTLTNISKKDGLQSNFANQIVESKDGKFWVATTSGLFRYDGNSLTNITENVIKKDDGIGCVFEERNGTLWLSVNKRDIYSFNGKEFTKIDSKIGDFKLFPFTIYQDRQDRLWFVGLRGAYRFENNNFIGITRNGPW